MAAAPVVHFEVTGKDAKKLQNFYSKMFEWNIQNMPEMEYGMVETSGKAVSTAASVRLRRAHRAT